MSDRRAEISKAFGDIARVRRQNIQEGKCPDCGGSGVVANIRKITETGDPHANKRCPDCRGTGKLRDGVIV